MLGLCNLLGPSQDHTTTPLVSLAEAGVAPKVAASDCGTRPTSHTEYIPHGKLHEINTWKCHMKNSVAKLYI